MSLLRLYAAATTIAAPALGIMLARRAARGKEIVARLPERRGIDPTPRPAGRLLWLHAASVGAHDHEISAGGARAKSIADIIEQHRAGEEVVERDIEEARELGVGGNLFSIVDCAIRADPIGFGHFFFLIDLRWLL